MKCHGIKGEVKVISTSDFDRFYVGAQVLLKKLNQTEAMTIESIKQQPDVMIIKFSQIKNRNDAELFRGAEIFTKDEPQLDEDEYSYQELIGKEVHFKKHLVGIVKDLIFLPNQQTLVVEKMDQTKLLIPFVKHFVETVGSHISVINLEEIL